MEMKKKDRLSGRAEWKYNREEERKSAYPKKLSHSLPSNATNRDGAADVLSRSLSCAESAE